MSLGEAFVGAVASATTHKCLEAHKEDIKKAVDPAVNSVNKMVESGWERDYEAGGLSSWGSQSKTIST